jgi:hypothetical protein
MGFNKDINQSRRQKKQAKHVDRKRPTSQAEKYVRKLNSAHKKRGPKAPLGLLLFIIISTNTMQPGCLELVDHTQ